MKKKPSNINISPFSPTRNRSSLTKHSHSTSKSTTIPSSKRPSKHDNALQSFLTQDTSTQLSILKTNPNITNQTQTQTGNNLLYLSVQNDDYSLTQLLLDNSSNPNHQNFLGETPLHKAIEMGNHKTINLLLEKGADPNIQSQYGETPMHIAATKGDYKVIKLLLLYKADIKLTSNEGYTPEDYALQKGNQKCIDVLSQANCNNSNNDVSEGSNSGSGVNQYKKGNLFSPGGSDLLTRKSWINDVDDNNNNNNCNNYNFNIKSIQQELFNNSIANGMDRTPNNYRSKNNAIRLRINTDFNNHSRNDSLYNYTTTHNQNYNNNYTTNNNNNKINYNTNLKSFDEMHTNNNFFCITSFDNNVSNNNNNNNNINDNYNDNDNDNDNKSFYNDNMEFGDNIFLSNNNNYNNCNISHHTNSNNNSNNDINTNFIFTTTNEPLPRYSKSKYIRKRNNNPIITEPELKIIFYFSDTSPPLITFHSSKNDITSEKFTRESTLKQLRVNNTLRCKKNEEATYLEIYQHSANQISNFESELSYSKHTGTKNHSIQKTQTLLKLKKTIMHKNRTLNRDHLIMNTIPNQEQELNNYLSKINMSQYSQVLIKEGFDDIDLLIKQMKGKQMITDNDLNKVGITIPGHRARILIKLQLDACVFSYKVNNTLINEHAIFYVSSKSVSEYNQDHYLKELYHWFSDIKLTEVFNSFYYNGYHSVDLMLFQMMSNNPFTDEMLEKDFNVNKIGHRLRIMNKLYEDSCVYMDRIRLTTLITGIDYERESESKLSCNCLLV